VGSYLIVDVFPIFGYVRKSFSTSVSNTTSVFDLYCLNFIMRLVYIAPDLQINKLNKTKYNF